MAALRSLEAERWEQEIERLETHGIRNRWDKEALWQAHLKLRQAAAEHAAVTALLVGRAG